MRRGNDGVSVGSASVLMVFVVLSLTVFAVLSLVSANSEQGTSNRNANAIADYYEADRLAVQFFDAAAEKYNNNGDFISFVGNYNAEITKTDEGTELVCIFEIDENRSLYATALISEHGMKIIRWNVITAEQELEDNTEFWDGEDFVLL